jgi:hypothetical protein
VPSGSVREAPSARWPLVTAGPAHARMPAPTHRADGRPAAPDFVRYLPWFLAARPSAGCAKGGAGVYSDLIMMTTAAGEGPESDQPQPQLSSSGGGHASSRGSSRGSPARALAAPPSVGAISGLADRGVVAASAFRTFYTPLNQQQVCVALLRHGLPRHHGRM